MHGRAWPTSRASPNGGNCSIRGATRRRHAEAKLLMVQNPHSQRCDALRKGQRARSGPGAACFPMTPLANGGKCTMRGARSGSPHVEGATKRGNCTIRAATRRRHAVGRLLMVQNPHRQRCDRRPCIQQQTRHITTVLRYQTTTSSHNRHLTCRRHSHPLNEVSTTQAKPQLACG